jgi:hypothetical protein
MENRLVIPEFEETQTFGGTPLGWVIIATTVGTIGIVIGVTATTNPTMAMIAIGVIVGLDLFFLWGLRLRTIVAGDELLVGFRPLPLKRIPIASITRAEAVRYSPMGDAGGWGWKHSKKFGPVRNVWGDDGVAIEYGEKGRLLIGSRRAGELAAAIHRLNPGVKPASA